MGQEISTLIYIIACDIILLGIASLVMYRRNFINSLLALELIFLGINLIFANCSHIVDNINGQILALGLLAVSAAESSLGLSIILLYFRIKGYIEIKNYIKS